MSTHPPLSPTEALERDLLKRLGLPPTASQEEISAAHQAVVAYLSSAPHDLAGWARAQAAGADEAYALLTDPAALASSAALAEHAAWLQVPPGGPATPPARRATASNGSGKAQRAPKATASTSAVAATAATETTGTDDEEFEALLAAVTPSAHRDAVPSAPKGAASHRDGDADEDAGHGDDDLADGEAGGAIPESPAPRRGFPMQRAAIAGALVVGAIAIAMVGYNLGGGGAADAAAGGDAAASDTGADTTTGTALDTEAVAALMEKIQADPSDLDALMQLGDQFYVAEDFATAASWFAKAAEVDPAETKALLALGAAEFNQGNLDEAKTAWLNVLDIDEDNVEAHYDLGFLYLNQQPPDMEGVVREWTLVVTLAPDSDIAQTVQAHLDAFAEASPGASAAPSAAPGSAAPASPAPDGSVEP
jgi:tetratricopeptide (TPR) repeat protein